LANQDTWTRKAFRKAFRKAEVPSLYSEDALTFFRSKITFESFLKSILNYFPFTCGLQYGLALTYENCVTYVYLSRPEQPWGPSSIL